MLASVRNIPFLIWNGTNDELVPVAGVTAQAQTFDDLGYRYVYDLFTGADHFALAENDQFAPAARFLGVHSVNRNPAHVTYVVNPTMSFRSAGTVADHAYWLSGLRLADRGGEAPLGEVDARSAGFGRADPPAKPTQSGGGALTAGNLGALPYVERSKAWGKAPSARRRDVLHLDAQNLARMVVYPGRARLNCRAKLDVSTDSPLAVKLAGCGRTLHFGP
jgi:hypothetical protein